MKALFLSIILMSTTITLASTNAQQIYQALNVQEESLAASRTELKYLKSVGGLECIKTNHIQLGDSYTCKLDFSQPNEEEIYKALDLEEVALPSFKIELKHKKATADLTCLRVNHIQKGIYYNCFMVF